MLIRRKRLARAAMVLSACWTLLLSSAALAHAMPSNPDDPFFAANDQWALAGATASIQAPDAWCVATGKGITVADVDTGADFSQPDLAGKLIAGAQFLGGTATYPGGQPTGGPGDPAAVADGDGHGTMTAGIIGADTGNGIGIAAVAPSVKLLIVKVLDNSGHGYDSDVANGIVWAVDNGAQVINLSIGPDVGLDTTVNSDIPSAIQYAAQNNVAVAIAAGNSSLPTSAYLGIQQYALVVGALNPDGTVASYSNYSASAQPADVSIYAPGGTGTTSTDQATQLAQNIVSTYLGGGYATGAGTSFATPQVAGTLALLMGMGDSAATARNQVLATAVTRGGIPELDTAAAVGHTTGCPGSTGAASAPPALQGSVASKPAPARHHRSPSASPSAGPPQAKPRRNQSTLRPLGTPSQAVATPGASPPRGPGTQTLSTPGSAKSPSPWQLVAIALAVVLVGATFRAWLNRPRSRGS